MKRVLCGVHPVREAMRAQPAGLALVLVTDDSPRGPHRELLEEARRAGVKFEVREPAELDALARGVRHQGVIAISGVDYPYVDLDHLIANAKSPPLFVLLDEITDVHNFGAIVRSAVAMGADGVVTLRDRAAPVNAAVVRASAGATERARIARVTNLARAIEALEDAGVACVGLDAEAGQTLAQSDLRGPLALVVGSEGKGLRRLTREKCSSLARIPMSGEIASLNASVAAALAIYEAVRQRTGG